MSQQPIQGRTGPGGVPFREASSALINPSPHEDLRTKEANAFTDRTEYDCLRNIPIKSASRLKPSNASVDHVQHPDDYFFVTKPANPSTVKPSIAEANELEILA